MIMSKELTQSSLKEILIYNPDTGIFIRNDRRNSNGSIDAYGYLILKIKGQQYKAHRLAWLYMYGETPSKNIDHINGKKLDNRICNLRDVDQSVNVKNTDRTPNPDTGFIGIHYDTSTKGLLAKYTTRINGKTFRFRKVEKAIKIRKQNGMPV